MGFSWQFPAFLPHCCQLFVCKIGFCFRMFLGVLLWPDNLLRVAGRFTANTQPTHRDDRTCPRHLRKFLVFSTNFVRTSRLQGNRTLFSYIQDGKWEVVHQSSKKLDEHRSPPKHGWPQGWLYRSDNKSAGPKTVFCRMVYPSLVRPDRTFCWECSCQFEPSNVEFCPGQENGRFVPNCFHRTEMFCSVREQCWCLWLNGFIVFIFCSTFCFVQWLFLTIAFFIPIQWVTRFTTQ